MKYANVSIFTAAAAFAIAPYPVRTIILESGRLALKTSTTSNPFPSPRRKSITAYAGGACFCFHGVDPRHGRGHEQGADAVVVCEHDIDNNHAIDALTMTLC